MKQIILCCTFIIIFDLQTFSQTEAKFSLSDDSQKIMCYTGLATRNTTVTFKNTSVCNSGNCLYIWNYGDSSKDSTTVTSDVTKKGSHTYTTDGQFLVKLYVVDPKSIADSIKNRPIKAIEYYSSTNDSANISVTYTATDNSTQTADIRIPINEFSKKSLPYYIEVHSPLSDGKNFSYEIDDPSTSTSKAGLESFIYILSVNTDNFTPHENDVWKYYWNIYNGTTLIDSYENETGEYRFTFPKENFDPGYTVQLKIALDSSKFDPADIEYYNLQECFAVDTMTIKVTDYFFTDSTRTKTDIDDREIALPNVFTPGGNDENDVFYFNTNGVDDFSIWIYNNNGALIYSQNAKTISWTGVDNSGHNCKSGTYFYVLKSDNPDKRHNTSGFIHLFRQN